MRKLYAVAIILAVLWTLVGCRDGDQCRRWETEYRPIRNSSGSIVNHPFETCVERE